MSRPYTVGAPEKNKGNGDKYFFEIYFDARPAANDRNNRTKQRPAANDSAEPKCFENMLFYILRQFYRKKIATYAKEKANLFVFS